MTKAHPRLIKAIEKTAAKLAAGSVYQWGHMGVFNCGNPAQELTHFTKAEIHQFAMQKFGDWNEQLLDYCPTSGLPMDLMISGMLDSGLKLEDLAHLEGLSDREILAQIPNVKRDLMKKNSREDVVLYLLTWAKILREKWVGENDPFPEPKPEKKIKDASIGVINFLAYFVPIKPLKPF